MAAGVARERLIERRPAIRVDLPLEAPADFQFAARTELQGDELRRASAQTAGDIVSVDYEVAAVVSASPHQHMDMRILGVPVIDRHPVDLCPEVARHLAQEIAREGTKVG